MKAQQAFESCPELRYASFDEHGSVSFFLCMFRSGAIKMKSEREMQMDTGGISFDVLLVLVSLSVRLRFLVIGTNKWLLTKPEAFGGRQTER